MSSPSAPRAPGKSAKVPLSWIARGVVSAAVLAVVFQFVPVQAVWDEARRLPPLLWIGSLLAFLVGHAAAAAKWRLLIGPGPGFGETFRAHLAGLAANLCLPGVAGGDVVRAGLVYRSVEDPSRLAVGSVADRLLDTLGLVIIAALGAAVAFHPSLDVYLGSAPAVAASLAVAAVLVAGAVWGARRLKPLTGTGKVARLAARAVDAVRALAAQPGRLALCLAISMAVQITFIAINIAFALAAGVEAPVSAWVFAWSAAKIIAILPMSLGGLGVREASMAALLAPFGADPVQVVAIGLVWQTLLFASGLIGAVVQFAWRPGRREPAPPPGVVTERLQ